VVMEKEGFVEELAMFGRGSGFWVLEGVAGD